MFRKTSECGITIVVHLIPTGSYISMSHIMYAFGLILSVSFISLLSMAVHGQDNQFTSLLFKKAEAESK